MVLSYGTCFQTPLNKSVSKTNEMSCLRLGEHTYMACSEPNPPVAVQNYIHLNESYFSPHLPGHVPSQKFNQWRRLIWVFSSVSLSKSFYDIRRSLALTLDFCTDQHPALEMTRYFSTEISKYLIRCDVKSIQP